MISLLLFLMVNVLLPYGTCIPITLLCAVNNVFPFLIIFPFSLTLLMSILNSICFPKFLKNMHNSKYAYLQHLN